MCSVISILFTRTSKVQWNLFWFWNEARIFKMKTTKTPHIIDQHWFQLCWDFKVIWPLRMALTGMWQCWILDIVSILVSRSKNHTSRIHILSVPCLTCLMVTSITYDILPNSVVENLFPNVNIYIFWHNFLQTISIRWKYSFTIILFNMTLEIVVIWPLNNLGYDNIRGFPNFSLSKFAIPYFMKQNEYFRRRVLWKSCISDLGLNVECTEETNFKKRNKNNNMKIINR